jgi:hypothetical protein
MSFVMSVCPPGSHRTDFHKIQYLSILQLSVEKIQVSLKSDKNMGTLHEDQYIFLIISCSTFLRMRNVLDTSCRENENTHIMFSHFFENSAVHETMWKIVQGQAGNRCQYGAWALNAGYISLTNTHSEYVIRIAFDCNNGCTNAPQRYVYTYTTCLKFEVRRNLLLFFRTFQTRNTFPVPSLSNLNVLRSFACVEFTALNHN